MSTTAETGADPFSSDLWHPFTETPLVLWLWDATGPGNYSGVTDRKEQALTAVEGRLRTGQASTARVEAALPRVGGGWITPGYRRLGAGWSAVRDRDGTVLWSQLPETPRDPP